MHSLPLVTDVRHQHTHNKVCHQLLELPALAQYAVENLDTETNFSRCMMLDCFSQYLIFGFNWSVGIRRLYPARVCGVGAALQATQ